MTATTSPVGAGGQPPSPAAIIDAAFSYQRTFALKAAVDCDLFTAIGEGHSTVADIARARGIAERGARIVCDYLTTLGFLTKDGSSYALAPDAAMFLDRRSPAYLGSVLEFLASPQSVGYAERATEDVRAGGTRDAATTAPEHEFWPVFARAMASFMSLPAMLAAQLADLDENADAKVLDIAAGHGEFGFAVARRYPKARIVALDWKPVLVVTAERAKEAGLAERFEVVAGDAFDVDFGAGYDLVLVPNFLHHFNEATNVTFLRKVAAALKPQGQVVIVEFVPNEDRITPPIAARFAFTMLTNTQEGDAYTRAELERMLAAAGFEESEERPLLPTPQTAIAARKKS
ncbi:MAG TPA: class I SAM-dependent methyltransferase [Candidatus Baltobacteraceae bacterium]|jgi:ubiquinone/menaquinone biosynthesis C-methylase UbiE|nr:class I SAM-dependent methyltransferase [Candidatus Baltobacteraceae bacterium]